MVDLVFQPFDWRDDNSGDIFNCERDTAIRWWAKTPDGSNVLVLFNNFNIYYYIQLPKIQSTVGTMSSTKSGFCWNMSNVKKLLMVINTPCGSDAPIQAKCAKRKKNFGASDKLYQTIFQE